MKGEESMSITQQKSDLRAIIHNTIEQHLKERPDEAHDIAMGAVRRLSKTMTLNDLRAWHRALYAVAPSALGRRGEKRR